jgi:CrcB protein
MLGANLLFVIGIWSAERFGAEFPYGTLIVNVSGAFAIGVLLAFVSERVGIDPLWRIFLATGFLGGYTTFSSYTFEAVALVRAGEWGRGAWYVLGSNGLGLAACFAGIVLARLLTLGRE